MWLDELSVASFYHAMLNKTDAFSIRSIITRNDENIFIHKNHTWIFNSSISGDFSYNTAINTEHSAKGFQAVSLEKTCYVFAAHVDDRVVNEPLIIVTALVQHAGIIMYCLLWYEGNIQP